MSPEELDGLCDELKLQSTESSFENCVSCIQELYKREEFSLVSQGLAKYSFLLTNCSSLEMSGVKYKNIDSLLKGFKYGHVNPVSICYPPTQEHSDEYILRSRKKILATMRGESPKLTVSILDHLQEQVNKYFFFSLLPKIPCEIGKIASAHAYYRCPESNKGTAILFSETNYNLWFEKDSYIKCNGLKATNKNEMLLYVMEHEMLHYFIDYSCFVKTTPNLTKNIITSHGDLYKTMSYQLFRHTKCSCDTHEETREKAKSMFHVGQKVKFVDKKGYVHFGIISKINKVNISVTFPAGNVLISPNLLKIVEDK